MASGFGLPHPYANLDGLEIHDVAVILSECMAQAPLVIRMTRLLWSGGL